MGTDDSDQPFRFLDLPPELRVRVYEMVFEDDYPRELELADIRASIPRSSITAVSHLIHYEAIAEHKSAVRRFFEETKFYAAVCFCSEGGASFADRMIIPSVHQALEAAASVADLPIVAFDLRLICVSVAPFYGLAPAQEQELGRVEVHARAGGGVNCVWRAAEGSLWRGHLEGEWVYARAECERSALTRRENARYLNVECLLVELLELRVFAGDDEDDEGGEGGDTG